MELNKEEEYEEMNDSWWDKLEKRIAERTWMDNLYWWGYRHVRDTYHWWRRAPRRVRQYFKRGFADEQLWSLDWTIAKFVAPRLKRLKEIKQGHPIIEADERLCLGCWTYPEMWNRTMHNWDPDGHFHTDSQYIWDEILDKMIYAMDAIALEGDWDPPMGDMQSSDIRAGNAKWDAYCTERDIHYPKVKEGIELFGRFFGALWD